MTTGFNETHPAPFAVLWAALALGLLAFWAPVSKADAMGLSYTAYHAESGALVRAGDFVAKGDKLSIHIKYLNADASAAPAGALIFGLPEGCGLAKDGGDDRLSYSVDGGHSFGALAELTVLDHGRLRAARSADVTHVRLKLDRPLQPGQGGEVRVMASLR